MTALIPQLVADVQQIIESEHKTTPIGTRSRKLLDGIVLEDFGSKPDPIHLDHLCSVITLKNSSPSQGILEKKSEITVWVTTLVTYLTRIRTGKRTKDTFWKFLKELNSCNFSALPETNQKIAEKIFEVVIAEPFFHTYVQKIFFPNNLATEDFQYSLLILDIACKHFGKISGETKKAIETLRLNVERVGLPSREVTRVREIFNSMLQPLPAVDMFSLSSTPPSLFPIELPSVPTSPSSSPAKGVTSSQSPKNVVANWFKRSNASPVVSPHVTPSTSHDNLPTIPLPKNSPSTSPSAAASPLGTLKRVEGDVRKRQAEKIVGYINILLRTYLNAEFRSWLEKDQLITSLRSLIGESYDQIVGASLAYLDQKIEPIVESIIFTEERSLQDKDVRVIAFALDSVADFLKEVKTTCSSQPGNFLDGIALLIAKTEKNSSKSLAELIETQISEIIPLVFKRLGVGEHPPFIELFIPHLPKIFLSLIDKFLTPTNIKLVLEQVLDPAMDLETFETPLSSDQLERFINTDYSTLLGDRTKVIVDTLLDISRSKGFVTGLAMKVFPRNMVGKAIQLVGNSVLYSRVSMRPLLVVFQSLLYKENGEYKAVLAKEIVKTDAELKALIDKQLFNKLPPALVQFKLEEMIRGILNVDSGLDLVLALIGSEKSLQLMLLHALTATNKYLVSLPDRETFQAARQPYDMVFHLI